MQRMSHTIVYTDHWDEFRDKFIEMGLILVDYEKDIKDSIAGGVTDGVNASSRKATVQDLFFDCYNLLNRLTEPFDVASRAELCAHGRT